MAWRQETGEMILWPRAFRFQLNSEAPDEPDLIAELRKIIHTEGGAP
jgi:hypothetical protein